MRYVVFALMVVIAAGPAVASSQTQVQTRGLSSSEVRDQRSVPPSPTEQDSMSELGEQQQLRLQQSMERKSQMEQMLSNTMRSSSETSQGLASNIKD